MGIDFQIIVLRLPKSNVMACEGSSRAFLTFLTLLIILCFATTRSVECKPVKEISNEFTLKWDLQKIFQKSLVLPSAQSSGVVCAGCTIVVGLIEQLSQIYSNTTEEIMKMLCSWLPDKLQKECDILVEIYGPYIILFIDNHETPDRICNLLNACQNETCHLFPLPKKNVFLRKYSIDPRVLNFERPESLGNGDWPWERVADHKPFFDVDRDLFSEAQTLRGFSWRGADCNDRDASIYPGRKLSSHPDSVDHNCNGIFGVDKETGKTYEELLCGSTPVWGSILLGDSAGAHFHVPPEWITASELHEDVFFDMIPIAENEFDWPSMSSATGYENLTWWGYPHGPMDSAYLRIRLANRCSHRDYQNIGVNGARSGSMAHDIIKTFARNQTSDHPAFVTFALIGNDVCHSEHSSSPFTSPQEFYNNVVESLDYLDTVLPTGSRVMLIGLVDGRVLYDALANRVHPIGSTNNNVFYSDYYDYMNCLYISPCFGWMNTDAYWRNVTSQHAMKLNEVYKQIIANHTYKHFDMYFIDDPIQDIIDIWHKRGGETWQLIEPVDGFHPNQLANALTTEFLWTIYEKLNILPPVNPNNAMIEKLFGDQGGHYPNKL